MIRLTPFAQIALAVWLLALTAILMLAPAEGRTALLAGWLTAGLSGGLSFGLLAYSNRRPFKTFVASLLGGFLARLVIVGLGLWISLSRGLPATWFCLSFFSLYWLFMGTEVLAVRKSRPDAPRAPLPSSGGLQ